MFGEVSGCCWMSTSWSTRNLQAILFATLLELWFCLHLGTSEAILQHLLLWMGLRQRYVRTALCVFSKDEMTDCEQFSVCARCRWDRRCGHPAPYIVAAATDAALIVSHVWNLGIWGSKLEATCILIPTTWSSSGFRSPLFYTVAEATSEEVTASTSV